MKKIFALLLSILLVLCVLAGCAQQTPNTTTTEKPAADPTGNVSTTTTAAPNTTTAVPNTTTAGSGDVDDPGMPEVTVDGSTINLMGVHTVSDPEGVAFDKRTILYMPILETDDHYADGARELFCIIYEKDTKGVYMINVELFETADQAAAYATAQKNGEAKGAAYENISNADFFIAMEAFIPDAKTWIDNMMLSGMMEIE